MFIMLRVSQLKIWPCYTFTKVFVITMKSDIFWEAQIDVISKAEVYKGDKIFCLRFTVNQELVTRDI